MMQEFERNRIQSETFSDGEGDLWQWKTAEISFPFSIFICFNFIKQEILKRLLLLPLPCAISCKKTNTVCIKFAF
jgi:hypothetical protein